MGDQIKLSHVVAWEFEHGQPKPPGMEIDHECHNRAVREGSCAPGVCAHRLCCNPAHLVAKTRRKHRDDTKQWDCPNRGTKHALNVLTEEQVLEIKRTLKLRVRGTQRQMAAHYGVSESLISDIKYERAWAWLTE